MRLPTLIPVLVPLALSACAGPSVAESVVAEEHTWELPAAPGLSVLVVMDDTERTVDVWGRLTNGSKTFLYDLTPPYRFDFASTYTTVEGPLWFEYEQAVDHTAEWDGEFDVNFGLAVWAGLRERSPHERPAGRDALRMLLQSDRGHDLVDSEHLVVLMIGALDDSSDDDEAERRELRDLMESQPWGASLILVTPLSRGCRYEFERAQDGHDVTRSLLGASLHADVDLCDWGWIDPVVEAVTRAPGRLNFVDGELPFRPLPGTVEVFGVGADGEVELPQDQWEVDGTSLHVDPPLRGFEAVRVRYEREVRDE